MQKANIFEKFRAQDLHFSQNRKKRKVHTPGIHEFHVRLDDGGDENYEILLYLSLIHI